MIFVYSTKSLPYYGLHFLLKKQKKMEAVKSAIRAHINSKHGECIVDMDGLDLCMKIKVHRYPDYIIYVRPDDSQTSFACHYAHRDDVGEPRSCGYCVWVDGLFHDEDMPEKNECMCSRDMEVREWERQRRYLLVRFVRGRFSRFAAIASEYVDSAVEHIQKYSQVDSRALKVMTFREAQHSIELYPNTVPTPPTPPFRWTEKRKRRIVYGLT